MRNSPGQDRVQQVMTLVNQLSRDSRVRRQLPQHPSRDHARPRRGRGRRVRDRVPLMNALARHAAPAPVADRRRDRRVRRCSSPSHLLVFRPARRALASRDRPGGRSRAPRWIPAHPGAADASLAAHLLAARRQLACAGGSRVARAVGRAHRGHGPDALDARRARRGLETVVAEPGLLTQSAGSVDVRAHLRLRGGYAGFVGMLDDLARGGRLWTVERFAIKPTGIGPRGHRAVDVRLPAQAHAEALVNRDLPATGSHGRRAGAASRSSPRRRRARCAPTVSWSGKAVVTPSRRPHDPLRRIEALLARPEAAGRGAGARSVPGRRARRRPWRRSRRRRASRPCRRPPPRRCSPRSSGTRIRARSCAGRGATGPCAPGGLFDEFQVDPITRDQVTLTRGHRRPSCFSARRKETDA